MIDYISSLKHPCFASLKRKVCLLGSTGSIGVNALKVIASQKQGLISVVGLAGARNVKLLATQANEFRPRVLGVLTAELAAELKGLLVAGYSPDILVGPKGYQEMASSPDADIVLAAQVGAAGLGPTMAAVNSGKVVALANKEALVLGGDLVRKKCRESGAVILPVDSEHNALFQCLEGHWDLEVSKLILTASGGPFREKDASFLQKVTPDQALKHPNWSMGAKISIDSATLMNKGLEVIEAARLYGLGLDQIEIVVHPQSIVHSLVEYCDGSVLAHMGVPDMRIPIAHSLFYPERNRLGLQRLDLAKTGTLTFEPPRKEMFPCLSLAMQALESGGGYPVVLNAANEIAVESFLNRQLSFLGIPRLIETALSEFKSRKIENLSEIEQIDLETRAKAEALVKSVN